MDDPNTEHDDFSMPCVICGMDLSSVQTLRLCPKCKTPVARSIPGDGLLHSDFSHIKALRCGWLFVIWSLIGSVIVSIPLEATAEIATPIAFDVALLISLLALTVLGTIGWWKLSTSEKRIEGTNDGAELRHVLRIMLILAPVLSLVSTGLEFLLLEDLGVAEEGIESANASLVNLLALLLGLAELAINIGLLVTIMLYLRWLAPRIPSIKARRRAKRTLWWSAGVIPSVMLLAVGYFLLQNDISSIDTNFLRFDMFLFGGLALLVVCVCMSILYFLGTMRSIWIGIDPIYKAKLAEQRAAAE